MLKYRPDIDGLRAVAVLLVLFHHAFPLHLSGGFIGVDIFFVISGYLITTINVGEIEAGSFNLWHFYIRRICRIIPALLVVMLAALIAGWFFFLPSEFEHLGEHIAAGASFLSNLLLYSEDRYFNKASDFKPLLHLWSLAIEEQFYLIWPFVMIVGWKRPKLFFPIFWATILLSFGLNNLRVTSEPSKAFFVLNHRVWELLLGSLLAFFYNKPSINKWFSKFPTLFSSLGFFLILIGLFTLDQRSPYPGFRALLPTVGALLIIASPYAWPNQTILSHRAVVAIGLISYPLYLWHWPIFSFAHILKQDITWIIATGIIATSLILATLTYRLIERPIRVLSFARKKRLTIILVFSLFLAFVIGVSVNKKLIRTYTYTPRLMKFIEAVGDWDFPGKAVKIRFRNGLDYYVLGTGEHEVVLIGDSHIMQYYPRIEKIIQKNQTAFFITSGACPPIPDMLHKSFSTDLCQKTLEMTRALINRPNVKTVVVGPSWEDKFLAGTKYYFKNPHEWPTVQVGSVGFKHALGSLGQYLLSFKKLGKKVFLILSIPAGDAFDPGQMFDRSFSFEPIKFKTTIYRRGIHSDEYVQMKNSLRMAAESAGATVIDPFEHLCNRDACDVLDGDGWPKYHDNYHLRARYVREQVFYLDDVMK